MITQKKLAQELGVSIGTVSLSLADSPLISNATKRRVRELAKKLGYRPSNLGRALQSGRSMLIGCLFGSLLNSFFAEILEGISSQASLHGYSILNGYLMNRDAQKPVDQMLFHRVDGVIFIGNRGGLEEYADLLTKNDIPVIFCSSHRHGNFPFVVTDDFAGGRMAVEHLAGAGHRKILIENRTPEERMAGCMAAAASCGIQPELFDGIEELPEKIRRSGATAVVFFADIDAVDAMFFLRKQGFRIPEDVSIIGYDDIPLASRPEFMLSTIAQQRRALGERATDYLLQLIGGRQPARRLYLPPELKERGTVCPHLASRQPE